LSQKRVIETEPIWYKFSALETNCKVFDLNFDFFFIVVIDLFVCINIYQPSSDYDQIVNVFALISARSLTCANDIIKQVI